MNIVIYIHQTDNITPFYASAFHAYNEVNNEW